MAVDGSKLGAYFCLDQDGDAFGNPIQPVWVPNGVAPPPSFVVDCTDLDDADNTIYIGAPCDILNPNTAAYIDSNGVCIDTLIDPLSLLCEPDSCGLWNVEINGDCYYGSCWTTGIATVYGSGSGGNCGWDDEDLMLSPFNGKVAAVGSDLWDAGLGCGDVYDILCTFGSNTQNCTGSNCTGNIVRVMVVDQCPECTNTHLDLSSAAWAELITSSGCVADIEFRRVGHEYGVNIQVDVKSGSGDYFLEFYPKFSNKTIQTIEVSSNASSTFYQVEHTENQGFWKIDVNTGISLPLQFPLSFKFTSNDGDVILAEDVLISSQSIGNVDSGVNFSF